MLTMCSYEDSMGNYVNLEKHETARRLGEKNDEAIRERMAAGDEESEKEKDDLELYTIDFRAVDQDEKQKKIIHFLLSITHLEKRPKTRVQHPVKRTEEWEQRPITSYFVVLREQRDLCRERGKNWVYNYRDRVVFTDYGTFLY